MKMNAKVVLSRAQIFAFQDVLVHGLAQNGKLHRVLRGRLFCIAFDVVDGRPILATKPCVSQSELVAGLVWKRRAPPDVDALGSEHNVLFFGELKPMEGDGVAGGRGDV